MAPPSPELEQTLRLLRFGEFELDLREETLRHNGEKLSINNRMFQVLRLLVEKKGEIVSKNEFFEKVWDGSFVEDNNLTVTITALRKVLGDNAKQARFVENIPRKGYRFIAPVETIPDQASQSITPTNKPTTLRPFFLFAVVAVFLIAIMAIAGAGYRGLWPSSASATTTAAPIDSIAVLPFENRTSDSEYLVDGLTDGIINDLSRLSSLRVIDRNSTNQFKSKMSDPVTVGRELNVRSVVTGRIEQNGDVIIVTAELIDLLTNSPVWRQQFRRMGTDLFATQLEISQAIIQKIAPDSLGLRSSKRHSADPAAYNLYLKGRYHWNKRTAADLQRSAELFRNAIERDPTFAQAYVGLADAYTLGDFPLLYGSPEEKNAVIRGTIQKALEIDPDLGEAYASLAINKCYYDWDLAGAENDYRRALELNPNDATAHHWYAEFLTMQGRFDESIAEYDRAISLDPLSLPIKTDKALSYYYARDYDSAIDLINKILGLDPNYKKAYESLFFVRRQQGRFNEAVDAMKIQMDDQFKRGERSTESYEWAKRLALNLRKGAETAGSEGFWKADLKYGDVTPMSRAVTYAKLGNIDEAFNYLDKAVRARSSGMVWLKVMPELDSLRPDPRYQDLLVKVGFSN